MRGLTGLCLVAVMCTSIATWVPTITSGLHEDCRDAEQADDWQRLFYEETGCYRSGAGGWMRLSCSGATLNRQAFEDAACSVPTGPPARAGCEAEGRLFACRVAPAAYFALGEPSGAVETYEDAKCASAGTAQTWMKTCTVYDGSGVHEHCEGSSVKFTMFDDTACTVGPKSVLYSNVSECTLMTPTTAVRVTGFQCTPPGAAAVPVLRGVA